MLVIGVGLGWMVQTGHKTSTTRWLRLRRLAAAFLMTGNGAMGLIDSGRKTMGTPLARGSQLESTISVTSPLSHFPGQLMQ